MKIQVMTQNGRRIADIESETVLIEDVESALDFLGSIRYETDCDAMMFPKETITEAFFDLKTKLAGEILQKFVTYEMRVAIYGDFSVYTSKALKDFIYESNKGTHITFAASKEEAVSRLVR